MAKGQEDEKIEDWLHSVKNFPLKIQIFLTEIVFLSGESSSGAHLRSHLPETECLAHYKSHIQIQHKNVKQFQIFFLNPTQIQPFVAFLAPNRDKISNSVKNHQSLNHLQNKLSGTCIFIRDECIFKNNVFRNFTRHTTICIHSKIHLKSFFLSKCKYSNLNLTCLSECWNISGCQAQSLHLSHKCAAWRVGGWLLFHQKRISK